MKLTFILVAVAIVNVSANGISQTVSFKGKNASLQEVFSTVEKQTGFAIFCNADLLDKANTVTLNVTNVPLKDFLQQVFKDQPLDFSIKNTTIVISAAPVSSRSSSNVEDVLPPGPIKIFVTGEDGQALTGATITIKKSKNTGVTNAEGVSTLNLEPGDVITVSYVGYESQDITIKNTSSLTIYLKQSLTSLHDVVVNKGYYNTTNRLNTGDVSVVKADVIAKQPVSNPLAALEGRVPGLVITQQTGVPGGAFTVQIRGRNSLNTLVGGDPLYVVDGAQYLSAFPVNTNINSIGKGGNPLSYLNPADILSIEVLKDADATAIYGSRGANGVILITTKKAKLGAMQVDVNFYSGIGKVTRNVPLLNTNQYLNMRHQAFSNDNVQPTKSNAPDLLVWDTTRYTNWQKELIGGSAKYTDVQANISGGTEGFQYLIGSTYHRETTVFPGDNADQKASIHFALNSSSSNKKFKVQFSGNYLYDNNNLLNNDLTSYADGLAPDAPAPYNPDGTLNWAPITPGAAGTWTNPYSLLKLRYIAKTSNFIGNAIVSYKILPSLDAQVSASYNSIDQNEMQLYPSSASDPGFNGTTGTSNFSNTRISSWIIEPQLSYKIKISKGLLSALIGSTFQENTYQNQILGAYGFTNDAVLSNILAASGIYAINSTNSEYKYSAVYGRLNYNWQDKYLVNFTGRRDGSSRFGPGKQFANFGALGVAWIFTNENFMNALNPGLSFGKIRASYGTTGNDQIGDYGYLDLFNLTTSSYQNIQGYYPTKLFNPDLAWEYNKKLELGIEFGFLKDKILFSGSIYRNRSSNLLLSYKLSDVTGFANITRNFPATIQNTGIELSLTTQNIVSKTFKWTTTFNLTIPSNKLLSFPDLANSSYNTSLIIGQPFSVSRLYHLIEVDPETGTFEFADSKGDPVLIPSAKTDRTVIYNNSKGYYYGGMQNTLTLKSFELDFFIQFVHQNGVPYLYNALPGILSNQPVSVLNNWQTKGDIASFPRYTQNFGGVVYQQLPFFNSSDGTFGHGLNDASFLRLKNVSLSYNIAAHVLNKLKIRSLRIFIQCQNLFTITSYKGNDPETQNGSSTLPPLRVITGGVNVSF